MNTQRILYAIFSHDHAPQVTRLVATIRHLSPDSLICIHHDPTGSNLDASLFQDAHGVYVTPDAIPGERGDFSLVAQYLHAMNWCRDNMDFDWFVTITGLSYPINLLTAFEELLSKSEFDAFDPNQWPTGTAKTRYLFRYFKLPGVTYYCKAPKVVRNRLAMFRAWFNRSQPFLRIVRMPRGVRTRLGIRRIHTPIADYYPHWTQASAQRPETTTLSHCFYVRANQATTYGCRCQEPICAKRPESIA